jgi:hypothetical protein
MSVLSEAEIEELRKTDPRRRKLRIISLLIGLVIILIGVVLLLTGTDFGITISGYNISLIVDVLIMIIGAIVASKYFIAPYSLHENAYGKIEERDLREPVDKSIKFRSVSITRLIAAILFLIVCVYTLIVFGTALGDESTYGSFFSLGGPSYFYPMGIPAFGISFGLFLYFFLSLFKGTFSQSKNFYFFYEKRPACPWLTEIPRKDIEAVRYQNNYLGPKLSWIVLLMPFIGLQLMTAIPLFGAHRGAPEYVFSWTLTICSIIEIIALILLVIFPQNYYEIATKDRVYEMWFSPLKRKNKAQFIEEFSEFLGCDIKKEIKSDEETDSFSDVNSRHYQLFNVVFGLLLFISAIIMHVYMVLFGPLVYWGALIYGAILLVKSISYDFSNKGGETFHFDENSKMFKFKRNFGFKFHYVSANNVESTKTQKWYRKLDFFDIVFIGWLLIMMTLQQVQGWALADTLVIILDNLLSTFFMIIVLLFIILYLCVPIDVVEFKTETITYRIRITKKLKEKNLLKKYINNLKSFPKEVRRGEMKKTFYLRLGIILSIIVISAIVTTILLITYFI